MPSSETLNDEAFRQLVEKYHRAVFGRCYRLLGNQDDAADATQEVFLRVYRSWDHFDPQRPLLPWIMTIATRLCIDRLRRRRINQVPWEETLIADGAASLEEQVFSQEARQKLRQLVAQLPEIERTLVILHYWENLSYEEIARQVGLTVGAVKSRLYRARRWLAQAWEQQA
ncbi:MAG: sigma-70 family RNA polymerase sigma factor [Chloroflexi bacterium]|nr:sigma-70 family RNA polymerase sigma factor [Chloroflexota bacterium]